MPVTWQTTPAAGLDVVYTEPIRADNPLHHHAAHLVGAEGEPPAHHGLHGGEREGFHRRHAAKRRQ